MTLTQQIRRGMGQEGVGGGCGRGGGKGEGGRGNPAVVRWNDGVEKAARTEDGQYLEVQKLTHSIKQYYNRLTI